MKNGLIIPCYNESARLDLDRYLDYATEQKDTLLCFVNDGSSDMTRSTLADLKNIESDNVLIYNISENGGKANAVRKAALYLFNETDVDTVGFIDADLSTDFYDYHALVDEINGNDKLMLIYGSRAKNKGNNIKRDFVRSIISSIINLIILFIIRVNIKDTQCGAKVFRRSVVPLAFRKPFVTRWLFDVEIILRIRGRFKRTRFREIFLEKALKQWIHVDGSKLGLRDAVQIPVNLLNIWFQYRLKYPFVRSIYGPSKIMIHKLAEKESFKIVFGLFQITEVVLLFVESKWLTVWDYSGLAHLSVVLIFVFAFLYKKTVPKILTTKKWLWVYAYVKMLLRKIIPA